VLDGALSARAWVYRPPLVGPASGSVTVQPAGDAGVGRGVLTAPDPAAVTRDAGAWLLAAEADAPARALVGGPRFVTGSVRAVVHVRSGGVALIAQQTGPGQAVIAELAPDRAPRVVQLDAGSPRVVCSGSAALAAFDPVAPVVVRLAITAGQLRLTVDDRDALTCSAALAARGAWGVAALGAGAAVAVDSVTVARP
jgi:hypothetical protein